MDQERFDGLTRMLGRNMPRRRMLGALMAAAGLLAAPAAPAKRQRDRTRTRKQRRVGAEASENTCLRLCELIFPRPGRAQNRCVERAIAKQAACECPSFCRRLFPRDARRQLACLREALEDGPESLCLQCGADPDLACAQNDGSHICCGSLIDMCVEGSCCTPKSCSDGCTCGMFEPGCGLPPINCAELCGPGTYCAVTPGFGLGCCDCNPPGDGGLSCSRNSASTCPNGDETNPGSGGLGTCPGGGGGGGGGNSGGNGGSGGNNPGGNGGIGGG